MPVQLRPALPADIEDLAALIVGDLDQPSTQAGMRLFALERREDAMAINRVMLTSGESWRSVTVADDAGAIGMVQIGESLLSLNPEVAALAVELYGDDFMAILGPRLAALQRVQAAYPEDCLLISEIHVSAARRGRGVGTALFEHALDTARREGRSRIGLQTLTSNPARLAFEAWGFEVANTTIDVEFEALTGAAGYHLMLRTV